MKIKLLLLALIIITSCQKEKTINSTENGRFSTELEINKKLIDENPESYYYLAQRALLLEISEKDKEAQNYYSKAREKFYLKEESYWKKYDSVSMATMLMEICDSVRSRKIIKLVIKNKSSKIPENELNKLFNQTHGEILESVKLAMLSKRVETKTDNGNIENILEDRN